MSKKWIAATLLTALALAAGLRGLASGDADRASLPPDLTRIPAKGIMLLSFRPAELWNGALGQAIRKKLGKETDELTRNVQEGLGLPPDKIERLTLVMMDPRGPETALVFVSATEKFDRGKLFNGLVPGGKEEKLGEHAAFANEKQAIALVGEKAFVFGPREHVETALSTKPGTSGRLAEAARLAAGKHTFVAAVNPAALPPLPEELPPEAEPFKPLVKARLATLTVDFDERTVGQFRAQFEDNDAAAAGLKAVEAGRKLLRDGLAKGIKDLGKDPSAKGAIGLLRDVDSSLRTGTVRRDGRDVLGSIQIKLEAIKIADQFGDGYLGKIRTAALRATSVNNLKQIGLAMHNYHDVYNSFPAQAIYDKDGKPLLSWRVQLLPFLDQNDLYKEFKLDEPWDSPHNKKLLAKMPKVFQLPTDKQPVSGLTYYQGFLGKGAAFEGKRGLRVADITDGTSNTILVAEAAKGVPWTKPEDLPFDPDGPLPKLGGVGPNVHLALFGDGSVRTLPTKIDPKTLRLLITRNDGQVIPDF